MSVSTKKTYFGSRYQLERMIDLPLRIDSSCSYGNLNPFVNSYINGGGSDVALIRLKQWVSEYQPREATCKKPRRGIILFGPPGVGKTHMIVAMLKELYNRGVYCPFITFSHLLGRMRYAIDTKAPSITSALNDVISHDMICLDDLGSGCHSQWSREQFDYIITKFYNEQKIIIGTTNLDINECLENPNTKQIDAPVFSRLVEMCDFVKIGGDDMRRVNDGLKTPPRSQLKLT